VATVTGLATGVAAAVNGEVVPRRSWPGTQLHGGDQVEVVTAVQGG
jgi:sulfur carrier protein